MFVKGVKYRGKFFLYYLTFIINKEKIIPVVIKIFRILRYA